MQLNSLYEKFNPMQDFYKGLLPNKSAKVVSDKISMHAKQLVKNTNSTLKAEASHLMASGAGNGPQSSQEAHRGANMHSGAQTIQPIYQASAGQAARRFKPSSEKQMDRHQGSKATALVRDPKKSRKQEANGQDKKKNQQVKKSNTELKNMETQSQNDADTSSQQANLDESNAKCNSMEGYQDDSQVI